MVKNVKNIFKNLSLACAVVLVMVADCSYAQTMGESTGLKTIICGEETLCTIGKEVGQSERVCIEIKKIGKNKCDYKCQGAGEELPSDCSKRDKYTCQKITQSKEDCNLKNNGNAVNPAFLSKDYEDYEEASYSKAEREGLPNCKDIEGGSATCICNGTELLNTELQFTPVVCNKGQVCLHQTNTAGKLYNRYDHNDYYCMYKEQLDVEGARKKNSIWHNTEVVATNGEELTAEMNTTGCPLVSKYLRKYTSGCWSCLVVEKLTSAFLRVASTGLPVCESAGKTLLLWGFIIWLCFWALKNVVSFTEIKGGNALNDLLKMGGKVVLAYFCILAGTEAIREFVITPIMGIGSTIAQGYVYDEKIMNSNKTMKDYGWEDFNWDFTVEDVKELEEENKEFMERTSTDVTPSANSEQADTGLTADQIAENEEISKENEANFAKSFIPNLLIPGVKDGALSSPAGPRNCTNCSKCHRGVDIGQGCGPTDNPQSRCVTGCIPYYAAGPGSMTYARPDGVGNGAGFSAMINHGKINGHTWQTNYFHMRPGSSAQFGFPPGRTYQVKQGEKIGCLGQSGGKNYPTTKLYPIHGHFEVLYDGEHVDPMMLPNGHIVKIKPICDCNTRNNEKSNCPASGNGTYTIYRDGKAVGSGWPAAGEGIIDLNTIEGGGGYNANAAADSLIISIPDIKYTGPADIVPRSVMNSMLAAVKAITDTTAKLMVLGNMATCFSNVKEGGAWHIVFSIYMTNLWMWVDGAILWLLGFVLTCVMAYYLVDISFKIGFAVMALPVVMGLWPFKVTAGKLADVISIIAKSSALFAFLTISAYYAIQLIVAGIGGTSGLEGFFSEFDNIISGSVEGDERDVLIQKWKDSFNIFSSGFILTLFACFYAYKLISKTTGDLVEKFYPDNVFGKDSNPMHKGMTTLASAVNKVNQKYGTGLLKDIAGHQVGKGIRNTLSVPRNLAIKGFNAVKGKIKNKKGGGEQ